jgi:hypothetical protein
MYFVGGVIYWLMSLFRLDFGFRNENRFRFQLANVLLQFV